MDSRDNIPKRIHITGGPGSGKSWLAQRLASLLGVEVVDIDGRGLAIKPLDVVITEPEEFEALIAARDTDLEAMTASETWVSDGSYVGASQVHFQRADLIVCMDVPWRLASYRIVSRHVKRDLARNNRFPGWRRLYQFWRWSRRFYAGRNPHGLNVWGTPSTSRYTAEVLQPYRHKVIVCRTRQDVLELLRQLEARSRHVTQT